MVHTPISLHRSVRETGWPVVFTCAILTLSTLAACAPSPAAPAEATLEAPLVVPPTQTGTPLPSPMVTSTPEPTATLEPTVTPLPPTSTPVPANTQRPTSTPLPSPDAKAMIAWKELRLPGEFETFSPEAIGIQEGANAFTLTDGTEYNISGSFLFANGENPNTLIYGYTILLPTDEDRQIFDQLIDNVENSTGYELTTPEDAGDIGDYSKGATGEVGDEHFTAISFRIDNIGASVFLRHKLTDEPGIEAKDVARVYARSIEQPTQYCAIKSASAVPGADIPTFEVEAEGFYPQEGRYILLEGEIVLDGEPITFTTGKLGQTGETVEQDGSLSDFIAVDIREQLAGQGYQNVQPIEGPIEFTLTVGGHLSQCEVTQTVIWP